MGYYRDLVNKAEEQDINAWKLLSAVSVDCQIADLTDDQYEAVVDFVYDTVLSTEAEPDDVCLIISQGLGDGDINRDMFLNLEGYKFMSEYVYDRI